MVSVSIREWYNTLSPALQLLLVVLRDRIHDTRKEPNPDRGHRSNRDRITEEQHP